MSTPEAFGGVGRHHFSGCPTWSELRQEHPSACTCVRADRELQLELCHSFWEHHQAQLGSGGVGTLPLPQAVDPLRELSLAVAREPWHWGTGLCHGSVAFGVTFLG